MGTNATGGSLYFDAGVNIEKLLADFEAARKAAMKFANEVEGQGEKIEKSYSGLGTALTGFFSVAAATGFISKMIEVRSEFQKLEIGFRTMLGSKEKADRLMSEVVTFAATTPFELTNLASATKQLLAFGVASEDVMGIMKAMGDVSAGLGVPIERLILNFGQIKNIGRLTGKELRDFAVAGVPLLGELAKQFGKTEEQVNAMVEAGKVGFEDVRKAFENMTGSGGRFENLMEKQSATMSGQISNLKDNFAKMMNELGKASEGTIYTIIGKLQNLVANYKDYLGIIKELIIAYGAYKAAVMVTTALQSGGAIANAIKGFKALRTALFGATAAQQALNKAQMANVIGLAVAAIAALVAGLKMFVFNAKSAQEITDDLKSSIEGLGEQQKTDELVKKYLELKDTAGDNVQKQRELKNTMQQLAAIYPGVIKDVDKYGKVTALHTEELIKQNDELRKQKQLLAEDNIKEAEQKVGKLNARYQELYKILTTQKVAVRDTYTGQIYYAQASEKQLKKARAEYIKLGGTMEELQDGIFKNKVALEQYGQVDIQKAVEAYKYDYNELFGAVDQLTREEAANRKKKIEELMSNPLSQKAIDAAKEQIAKLEEQMKLPVIQNEAYWKKKKDDAEAQLKDLDTQKKLSKEQIAVKADLLKKIAEYDKELEYFQTGKKGESAAEKALKKQAQLAEDERQLQEKRIAAQLQNREKEISLMKEGFGKKMAEYQLEYDKELAAIEKAKNDRVKELNDAKGMIEGQAGAVTIETLPKEDIAEFTRQSELALAAKNQKEVELRKESAKELKAIEDELHRQKMSDMDIELAESDKYYDELRNKAKQNLTAEDWFSWYATGKEPKIMTDITEAEEKEKQDIRNKYRLQELDNLQQFELAKLELERGGLDSEEEMSAQRAAIDKKYLQERIRLWKLIDPKKYATDIQNAQDEIDKIDKFLTDFTAKQTGNEKKIRKEKIATLRGEIKELKLQRKELEGIAGKEAEIAKINGEIEQKQKNIAAIQSESVFSLDNIKDGLIEVAGAMINASSASQETKDNLNAMMNVLSQAASGNYIGALISMVSTLAVKLMEAFRPESLEEFYDRISEGQKTLMEDYESAQKVLQQTNQGMYINLKYLLYGFPVLIKSADEVLNKTRKISVAPDWMINQNVQLYKTYSNYNTLVQRLVELQKRMQYATKISDSERELLQNEINDILNYLSAVDSKIQELTGKSVPELAASLADAFLSGTDAAAVWGKTVDEMIMNIIKNQMLAKLFIEPINKLMMDFMDSLSTQPDMFDTNSLMRFGQALKDLVTTQRGAWDMLWGSLPKEWQDLFNTDQEVTVTTNTDDVRKSLAKSIAEGFMTGKKTMVDFADDFEKLMRDAILETFQNKLLNQAMSDFYEAFQKMSGDSEGLTKSEIEELRRLYAKLIEDAGKTWEEIKELTGVTEDVDIEVTNVTDDFAKSVADGIAEGFMAGKSSMVDFAEDFEKLIKDAILQNFKDKILNEQMANFYEEFKKMSGDKEGLTKDEIEQLRKLYAQIIDNANATWEDIKKMTGITSQPKVKDTEEGIKGKIKGITESQADLLGGIMISMREKQVTGNADVKNLLTSVTDYLRLQNAAFSDLRAVEFTFISGQLITMTDLTKQMNQQLSEMRLVNLSEILLVNRQIELNTRYNKILPEIKAELVTLNTNLKNAGGF